MQNCFCHNFVKFPPTLIIFGTPIARRINLCKVQLLSTSVDELKTRLIDEWVHFGLSVVDAAISHWYVNVNVNVNQIFI